MIRHDLTPFAPSPHSPVPLASHRELAPWPDLENHPADGRTPPFIHIMEEIFHTTGEFMRLPTCRGLSHVAVFTLLSLLLVAAPTLAGEFNFLYERVVHDIYGNEIGYQTQRISSIDDLPSTSPWRAYLSQMVGTRTILGYAKEIAGSLNAPLNFKISDRNLMSSSGKSSGGGYSLTLCRHVTQYSSTSSKKFVFLHELGHVAMLNSYPSNYTFTGLDYGSDNVHYVDEILPNANTAWIEGWANAFAAYKNDGRVFNIPLNTDSSMAFLSANTFEEMTRNELFTAKALYDVMTSVNSGRDKVYDVIARTGPHYSLRHFCRAYLSVYPQDQVALAQILNHNSSGRMSLSEMLDYLNNGSNSVSRSFYNYLSSAGKLGGGSSSTSTNSTRKSWWSSIGDWFSRVFGGLFGSRSTAAAAQPDRPVDASSPSGEGGTVSVPAQVEDGQGTTTTSPQAQTFDGQVLTGGTDLASAQEEYYQAFADYTALCAKSAPDSAEVIQARKRMATAKDRLTRLQSQYRNR